MELVQKLMKKTSKYLFYSPMTEKVLTECPCTIKSVPRNLVDTSSTQTQNVVQVCRCLHDAGGSSVAVLCAVLRE